MVVREGFRKMLEFEDDMEVVGEAQDGRQAVVQVRKLNPAVILMDIAMPGLNGLEATRQILKALPEARIIILSAHSEDAYVMNAIDSGAKGYLLKQSSAQEVCRAIRNVLKGETYFSPSISKRMARLDAASPSGKTKTGKNEDRLTPREREVLQLIAEGKANKQTASDLGISIKTVEKHREHLMDKLDIHDTAGLTRYAIAQGIVESSVTLTIT